MLVFVLLFQLVNSQRGLVKSFKIFKSCIQRGGWALLEHTHTHTHTAQIADWLQMNQWSPTTPGSLVIGSKLWSWTEPSHSVIPSTTFKSLPHVSSFTVRKWSKKIGPSEISVFSRFRLRNRFTPAHSDLFVPATSFQCRRNPSPSEVKLGLPPPPAASVFQSHSFSSFDTNLSLKLPLSPQICTYLPSATPFNTEKDNSHSPLPPHTAITTQL